MRTMDYRKIGTVVRRSVQFPWQFVMGCVAVVTAVLAWRHVIASYWAYIALGVMTLLWLNTLRELHKETKALTAKAQEIDDLRDSKDEEIQFAVNLVSTSADYYPPHPGALTRDYHFVIQVENVASVAIHLEVVESSVWVSGSQGLPNTGPNVSHVLHPGRTIGLPLRIVPGLVPTQLKSGARCTCALLCRRAIGGKEFRVEIDFVAVPEAWDSFGWVSNWSYRLQNEIKYLPS